MTTSMFAIDLQGLRQPSYLENDSPATLGAQEFLIPPPGLLQIKACRVVESLKSIPHTPRSIVLQKELEIKRRLEEEKINATKSDLIKHQLRFTKIDDARKKHEIKQEKELLVGCKRIGALLPSSLDNDARFASINPATLNARTFLYSLDIQNHSSLNSSPAEKKMDKKIEIMRQRLALGEVISPPKSSKKSSKSPRSAGISVKKNDNVEQSDFVIEEPVKKEKILAGKTFLSIFVVQRYLGALKKFSEFESTADHFRNQTHLITLIVRTQRQSRMRFRRASLFRILIARVKIIRAVSRLVRKATRERRNTHIEMVKTFLRDVDVQCARVIKLKRFLRSIVRCQRVVRSFLSCTRCREKAILLSIRRLISSVSNADNQNMYKQNFDRIKKNGKHLVNQFIVRLRKAFTNYRSEYFRRLRENDNTPAFTELDIWHVKEYLEEHVEEDTTRVPPQYRGKFGRPFFRMFTRPYLENELFELLNNAFQLEYFHHELYKKKTVSILSNSPKKKKSVASRRVKVKRNTVQKVDVGAENDLGDFRNATQALLSVLQAKIKEMKFKGSYSDCSVEDIVC